MSESEFGSAHEIERLRRAFALPLDDSLPDGAEPELDAERIYRAAAGELPVEERHEIVDRIARDPHAAEAWRLAVELQGALAERARETGPGAAVLPFAAPAAKVLPRRGLARVWGALAAVLAVALGIGVWNRMHPEASTMRGGETLLAAQVADGARLARSDFRLAWAPLADPGVRYTVRVTTADLRRVAEARGLEAPSYRVPASALAGFPAGTRLLWLVEARTGDGRTVASPTSTVELAD
ncbi:MAG TPA: hypothetical protein VN783_13310 [Thermoanaerobaculia bacterium]|nr:hypothetical protein [Thermoanaerobaculia bacterium]